MAKFSLWQIFVALIAVAIGLSICRLPKGSWIDVPLATLGFYFVASIFRRAVAVQRLLREGSDRSRRQE